MVDDNINHPSPSDGKLDPNDDSNNLDEGLDGADEGDIAERGKGKKGAEERIHELVDEVKEARAAAQAAQDKAAELEAKMAPPPPPSSGKELTPEVQKAVDYLKGLGFTQKADVQAEVQAAKDRMSLDTEHLRLRGEYNGEDGKPAYKQTEIEKFMREQGIFNPEVAYKAMHEAELLDWALKKANSGGKGKAFIEKPGSSSASREDNTITREKLEEWMKTPEGRLKYEQNRDKILTLMAEGKL